MTDPQPGRPERQLFALVGPPEPRWKSVLRWTVGLVGAFALVWRISGLHGVEVLAVVVLFEGIQFRRLMIERDKMLDAGRDWHETPITLSIDRVRRDGDPKQPTGPCDLPDRS